MAKVLKADTRPAGGLNLESLKDGSSQ